MLPASDRCVGSGEGDMRDAISEAWKLLCSSSESRGYVDLRASEWKAHAMRVWGVITDVTGFSVQHARAMRCMIAVSRFCRYERAPRRGCLPMHKAKRTSTFAVSSSNTWTHTRSS
jgi:hypothetical protein